MERIKEDYIERLHAGWYGKLIGVRYGAPIEGWDYERIRREYGELSDYIVDYKDFAADDDSNGPMFFLRALEDYGINATEEQIGLTWLNYVLEDKGFFWWGGYGISTEHTAYLNLKNGVMAPRSGSIAQNTHGVAEQIGGQIFIDVWGLITPGNPDKAVEYARKAASVSHDGNGIYGALVVAAAISYAFVEHDIYKVLDKALSYVPKDSEYMRMATAVLSEYKRNKTDWRKCFDFIFENFGYDKYPGNCHIIPNSAVMLLSMLYGEGDFSKTINICNMCGWDTDCNVGNVGCIMGVLVGMDGIDYDKWIRPINDFFCCSSAVGSLNIMDVPWCAQYISRLGYEIAGETPTEKWKNFVKGDVPKYHFDLPLSTHGFRFALKEESGKCTFLNTDEQCSDGKRALKVSVQDIKASEDFNLFVKTFYQSQDFYDSRYDPGFSPILYPGEKVSCTVYALETDIFDVCVYVKDEYTGEELCGKVVTLTAENSTLTLDIPSGAKLISEAGIKVRARSNISAACLYIDSMDFSGKADFEIVFEKEKTDHWNNSHIEYGQFTTAKGIWEIDGNVLRGSCGDYAMALGGRHDFKDYIFNATMIPQSGNSHMINFRVQGIIRFYAVALTEGAISLLKNNNGYEELEKKEFSWNLNQEYAFEIHAVGAELRVYCNGEEIFHYVDEAPYLTGQIGGTITDGSVCKFKNFKVKAV